MLLWFVGGSVVIVWQVFRSAGFDYRFVVAGALLPLIEAPLGPRVLHTLLAAVVLLTVIMLATRRRRLARRRWLGLPIGLFLHLVLDGIWTRSQVFWWPLLGVDFGTGALPELSRGEFGLVLEALGALALWWCWRAFGLADPARRRRLWRTGRLSEV